MTYRNIVTRNVQHWKINGKNYEASGISDSFTISSSDKLHTQKVLLLFLYESQKLHKITLSYIFHSLHGKWHDFSYIPMIIYLFNDHRSSSPAFCWISHGEGMCNWVFWVHFLHSSLLHNLLNCLIHVLPTLLVSFIQLIFFYLFSLFVFSYFIYITIVILFS